MPINDFVHFDRFLRGVRRRLMLLQFIERVGVGVAISCGVALPLILLLALRGAESMTPTLLCIALGMVGGLAWGWARLPSFLETAMEADRQLQWADLLGTALLLRTGRADPWQQAVLLDADWRCRNLSPSSIFLRRLSSRTWSGIALALTFTLAVSAWVGSPANTLAHDAVTSATNGSEQPNDPRSQPLLAPMPIAQIRPSAAPPDGQDVVQDDSTPPAPNHGDRALGAAAPDMSAGSDGNAGDGQGGVLGRSNTQTPRKLSVSSASAAGKSPSAGGKPSGGNSTSLDNASAGNAIAGGNVSGTARRPDAASPWTSNDWPREVEAAERTVETEKNAAPFRDLIEEYFRRD